MAHEEKKVEIEGAGEVSTENKSIAMLIAVLALLLAITELVGNAAQVKSVQANIEASNLWAFYQAKAIRSTTMEVAAMQLEADSAGVANPEQKAARAALIAKLKATFARYESDPATGEGRKELADKAKHAEHTRERYEHKHEKFEVAVGAIHIAIVLASASIISGVVLLSWVSASLGVVGAINLLLGLAL